MIQVTQEVGKGMGMQVEEGGEDGGREGGEEEAGEAGGGRRWRMEMRKEVKLQFYEFT